MNFRVNINGLERGFQAAFHHLRTTEPQLRPPPIASVTKRSPVLICPRALPTDSARGIDAAEVLP